MALCSVPVFAGVAPDASASKAQTTVLQQNNKVVKGHIVDESGEPLIGVSVKDLGTNNGAVTDIDGNFTINGSGKNLEITYVGFQKQVVRPQGSMNIVLKSMNKELNEVVVVGYGVQKKVNLTGSVASVDMAKEALSRPTTTATQALQGMAAGVDILQGSGRPNGESFGINIRGVGTMNNASPLVLVDGMEMSRSNVNPNDIESISILKDAASCAIYGNRGANGVILVTTKTGQEGKVSVTYSGKFSINTPSKLVRWVSNYADYMEFMNEAFEQNGASNGPFAGSVIQQWRDAEKNPNGLAESGYPNYVAYPNTDWMDEIYNTKLMQEHSLSVAGREKRTRYNLGITYLDNPGTIVNTALKKYNLNLNLVSNITDWLEVGTHVWGFHTDQERSDVQNLTEWSFLKTVPGIYPYYDGKWGGIENPAEDGAAGNPLLNINGQGDSYYKHNNIFATSYAQATIAKDFTLKTQFGYETFQERHKYTGGVNETYSFSRNFVVNPAPSLDQVKWLRIRTSSFVVLNDKNAARRMITTSIIDGNPSVTSPRI